MLVVRQGHGIVGAIAVVGAAVGGQWERHRFGAKAIWSLLARDNAASFTKPVSKCYQITPLPMMLSAPSRF